MKTAEDLAIDIKHGLMWNQHVFKAETGKDYLTSMIKQIQLDAMKEGMRRASVIIRKHCISGPLSDMQKSALHKQCHEHYNAILTAAEPLTIDDINA